MKEWNQIRANALYKEKAMYKVYIRKTKYDEGYDCDVVDEYISLDAIKTYDLSSEEWASIQKKVEDLAEGVAEEFLDIKVSDGRFNLTSIRNDRDYGILAESEHYYIKRDYEDASIFAKPDSRRITCVGDFYGDPEDAYIDPEEKFCITVGCGLIKYELREPYEDYMYDVDTTQWIETGRDPKNIEWCDHIDEVTDEYVIVSLEGEEKRKYLLGSLKRVDE